MCANPQNKWALGLHALRGSLAYPGKPVSNQGGGGPFLSQPAAPRQNNHCLPEQRVRCLPLSLPCLQNWALYLLKWPNSVPGIPCFLPCLFPAPTSLACCCKMAGRLHGCHLPDPARTSVCASGRIGMPQASMLLERRCQAPVVLF